MGRHVYPRIILVPWVLMVVWIALLCKADDEEWVKPEVNVPFMNGDVDLSTLNAHDAAEYVTSKIKKSLQQRMATMFHRTAKSTDCRALVGQHFNYYLNGPPPSYHIPNECPEEVLDWSNLPRNTSLAKLQFRQYQPLKNESIYIDADNISFCFGILTHTAPSSTIRLIEILYEPGHVFVIHVDAKESSDSTYTTLSNYASTRDYIHLVPHPYRVRVNWGGFSMVNATMQLLRYSFGLLPLDHPLELKFHKFIHLASTSYPIASNTRIRETIASYPLDANMFNVIMKPTRPSLGAWHYFLECDDAIQRIHRLRPLTATGYHTTGVELHTSSQWFILSREFSHYLALAEPGSLVHQMLLYSQHVVVADETFFGTVLRNSKFCTKHHNTNFLHLEFDSWENEMEVRDERKCVMPEKDRCGRSPTTLTMDYLPVLELSNDLFARKFSDEVPSQIKDVLDEQRKEEEESLLHAKTNKGPKANQFDPSFEGHGVLIVAKETITDKIPLCMGLGPSKNKVRLIPCFNKWVPPTLAKGWETGAVIEEETIPYNRWELGPCSTDGNITRTPEGNLNVTVGKYSMTGPRCMLRQRDGPRKNRCLDVESHRNEPGGELQVYPCFRKWHQLISFGNDIDTSLNSIYFTMPSYMVTNPKKKHFGEKDTIQLKPQLCIGVYGRSNATDEATKFKRKYNKTEFTPIDKDEEPPNDNRTMPLSKWIGKQLLSVHCKKNDPATIEWIVIPYIVEDESHDSEEGKEQQPTDEQTTNDQKEQNQKKDTPATTETDEEF